jgi:membrane-associated phospholipid phosphatase
MAVSPQRGIPAADLAATVSYSRLRVGAPWLSDVVTGTVFGITVRLHG